jgi:hypothetical protein
LIRPRWRQSSAPCGSTAGSPWNGGIRQHRAGRQDVALLSAFATDTALLLGQVDIDEKSNEIPATHARLAELGNTANTIVILDALHCQKNCLKSPARPTSP